jgi:polysaccharide deacetylase family protein (PEP-CTERM system associated)
MTTMVQERRPGAGRQADAAVALPVSDAPLNVMTVDVEDYFQVSAFEGTVPREAWHTFESRVCRNTERLLEMFERAQVTATFFVLGWTAEHYPQIVRAIRSGGHELSSHCYDHRLVYSLTPEEFRSDLRRAAAAIEAAGGTPVRGYRAPSYSITRESLWALEVLASEGYSYDASIYPIRHDRYGIPEWPREIQLLSKAGRAMWELPGSTVRWAGLNLPVGGGGYFRMLPYEWTRRGILWLNTIERRPAMFYLHPWEIDPEQPRIAAGRVSRFRHYCNLAKTEDRLRRLLGEFPFGSIKSVIGEAEASVPVAAAAGISLET